MATTLQELDQEIDANTAATEAYIADVQALVAALQASAVAQDFSAELAKLQDSHAKLTAADVDAKTLLTPPAPPPVV